MRGFQPVLNIMSLQDRVRPETDSNKLVLSVLSWTVTHPDTNHAQWKITSVIRWELVQWYSQCVTAAGYGV